MPRCCAKLLRRMRRVSTAGLAVTRKLLRFASWLASAACAFLLWSAACQGFGRCYCAGTAIVAVSGRVSRRRRMGKVFEFLGISVAVVRAGDSAAQLRAAFSADVVYITAQQLAFTYLGDNALKDESSIVRPSAHRRQRCTGQLARHACKLAWGCPHHLPLTVCFDQAWIEAG